MHGSLSPFDMHNICFAAGPDFRQGMQDDLPSGNIDVAPTVLWILGVDPPQRLSGRILEEALAHAPDRRPSSRPYRLEATCTTGGCTWRQYLTYAQVNGVLYFEEGNGEQVWHKTAEGN